MRSLWFGPISMAILALIAVAIYSELPAQLAVHWNIQGEADGWMRKQYAIFVIPLTGLAVWALLAVVPRIDPRLESRQKFEAFEPTYWLIVNATMLFLGFVQFTILGSGLEWDLPVGRLVLVGLGLLFAIIGNEMGRLKSNWFAGIRTPWTLSDDEVWRRTHRLGGRAFVIAGSIAILAGLILPVAIATIITLVVLLGAAIVPTIYSYLVYRDRSQEGSSG